MTDPTEPDGRMPMCFDPATFRQEQVRRKAAEARVAELEEEARRHDTLLAEGGTKILELIDERNSLRANLAEMAGQLEAAEANAALFRADREGVYRNFEGAMNERDEARARLAEVERERDAMRGALETTKRDLEAGDQRLDVLRDIQRHLSAAGRPVVAEPRDEPPPMWWRDDDSPPGQVEWQGPYQTHLAHAWEITDRIRATCAPHPSVTEGPLRKALLDEQHWWACAKEMGQYALDVSQIERRLARINAALAASPPDGTAPERVDNRAKAVKRWSAAMLEKLDANKHKGDHWGDDDPRDLFVRVEQEMRELAEALAGNDGAKVIREAADVANMVMMVSDSAAPNGVMTQSFPMDATRPPDGMPGEHARCIVLPEEQCKSDSCPVHGPYHDAPPTVPGEPPRDGPVQLRPCFNCGNQGYTPYEDDDDAHQCRCCGNIYPAHAIVAPPTPPLTTERAPLDEAAGREALRACRRAVERVFAVGVMPMDPKRDNPDQAVIREALDEILGIVRRSEGAG